MLQASYVPFQLIFNEPGGTSRGVMHDRPIWLIRIWDSTQPTIVGVGECAPLRGLSCDDRPDYETRLATICSHIADYVDQPEALLEWPSIRFGVEMAFRDLQTGGKRLLFPSPFTEGSEGIRINGLVWMGTQEKMLQRLGEKLDQGFSCVKLKIGAINFQQELDLLKAIRQNYTASQIEIRLDANGAFSPEEALGKLNQLASYGIHSIEQPIQAGQWEEMEKLCRQSPIPIALDEELIGIHSLEEQSRMLQTIRPQFIILKPSLVGGFVASDQWIRLAEAHHIGWWITSALESNLGLNALAQWTFTKQNKLPQGLGTGGVFSNNFPSSLYLEGEMLKCNPQAHAYVSI